MEISFSVVTSREIPTFSSPSDSINTFEDLLAKGLLGLKSDIIESISMILVCVL